jgi:predicted RNase H-like nuclease (RuvC/YqgF family)
MTPEEQIKRLEQQKATQESKIEFLEKKYAELKLSSYLELLGLITSFRLFIKYVADDKPTHREKEFHCRRTTEIMNNLYQETFNNLTPMLKQKDYFPF